MHGPHERMQKKIHLISFDPYLLDICKLENGSLLVSQDGDRVIFQGTSRTIKIRTQGSDFTIKFLWVARIPIPTSGLTFMGTLRRLFIVLHFSVCLNIFRSAERHHLGFSMKSVLGRAQQTPTRGQVLSSNFVRHEKRTTKQYGGNRHLQPREKNKQPSSD